MVTSVGLLADQDVCQRAVDTASGLSVKVVIGPRCRRWKRRRRAMFRGHVFEDCHTDLNPGWPENKRFGCRPTGGEIPTCGLLCLERCYAIPRSMTTATAPGICPDVRKGDCTLADSDSQKICFLHEVRR
jgi:hypothetical protein